MPHHPTWLPAVPAILRRLREPHTPPFLDRATLESLFQVRRRQAINLMRRFGGYQVGRTFLVSTEAVIRFLEDSKVDEQIQEVQAQKQRVADFLGEVRRGRSLPRIEFPQAPKLSEITFKGLPPGIHLTSSRLSIDFDSPTDLLQKLFSLSQALANDFETFERALENRTHG